jgi:hypothetical protein
MLSKVCDGLGIRKRGLRFRARSLSGCPFSPATQDARIQVNEFPVCVVIVRYQCGFYRGEVRCMDTCKQVNYPISRGCSLTDLEIAGLGEMQGGLE